MKGSSLQVYSMDKERFSILITRTAASSHTPKSMAEERSPTHRQMRITKESSVMIRRAAEGSISTLTVVGILACSKMIRSTERTASS